MARVHGKDMSFIKIDNAAGSPVDQKADTIALNFTVGGDTHDTTTIGDSWHEATAGLKGGDEFTHEVLHDNATTTGIWAVYTGRLNVAGTFDFSDGARETSMETIVTKLNLVISVADMIKFTATHKIIGAVTFT